MLSTFIKRYVVSTSAMMLLEGYSSLDSKHPKRGRKTVFGPLLDVTAFLGLFFSRMVLWSAAPRGAESNRPVWV